MDSHNERRERESGTKRVFKEIMTENFPNLWKDETYRFKKLS